MADVELLRAFESCSLPHEEWTHRAHVRVAYLYASRNDIATATDIMRASVKRYHAATGSYGFPARCVWSVSSEWRPPQRREYGLFRYSPIQPNPRSNPTRVFMVFDGSIKKPCIHWPCELIKRPKLANGGNVGNLNN